MYSKPVAVFQRLNLNLPVGSSSTDFLVAEFIQRKNQDQRYSERAFARTLGLSPGFLNLLFRGKKQLSVLRAKKIAKKLPWTESRMSQFLQTLQNSSALKSMAKTEVSFALKHLKRLQIIEEVEKSRFRVSDSYEVPSTSSERIRMYHEQMFAKAMNAVDFQTAEMRNLRGLTIAFENTRLEEAKKDIQKFVSQFEKKYGRGPRDSVFPINTSTFSSRHRGFMKSFILAFALFLSTYVHATGGGTVGNGGNGRAAEFVRLATYGTETLSRQGGMFVNAHFIDLAAMGLKILKMKLEFTKSPLVLNGKRVHAINYPSRALIVVSEKEWDALNDLTKMQLVFHELWSLTFNNKADDNYLYSSAMATQIRNAGLTNPTRVTSLVSDTQNGSGQTFRAMTVRQGSSAYTHKALVIQKLQQLSDTLDVVTSFVVFDPQELPYKAESTISDLRLGYDRDRFMFETAPLDMNAPTLTCYFMLPEASSTQELTKVPLKCFQTGQ